MNHSVSLTNIFWEKKYRLSTYSEIKILCPINRLHMLFLVWNWHKHGCCHYEPRNWQRGNTTLSQILIWTEILELPRSLILSLFLLPLKQLPVYSTLNPKAALPLPDP